MRELKIQIPSGAEKIISRLEVCGFRADIVGGCVRDSLLGRCANDFDITTSASPQQMLEAFSDFRVIETGISHGTLTVISDSVPYEVTSYRIDGEYSDSRHPDKVTFTSRIEDDLCRRDFTVNAMAYSDRHGLTDLFGGREDLDRRLIRAVGRAEERFSEDALRILRALRFSSVLSFEIEEETALAAKKCKVLLENISKERIYTEWKKLVGGPSAYRVISRFFDIIRVFLPELSEGVLPSEDAFCNAEALPRMLALFAVNLGDAAPEAFVIAMQRLRTDKKTREDGRLALQSLTAPLETKSDFLRLLSKVGGECAYLTLKVRVILGLSDSAALRRLDKVLSCGIPYSTSELKIDGEELMRLGFSGKEISLAKNALLEAVMAEAVDNERDSLISEAKRLSDVYSSQS